MYAYCQNNPVMLVDPSGKLPVILVTVIAGALVGGISQTVANVTTGEEWHKGVLAATTAGAASPFIALALPQIAFLAPIFGGLAYAEINQYQYNGLENWNWDTFTIDYATETIGNYLPDILPMKNINKAWIKNLKFQNIGKNYVEGKVMRYLTGNLIKETVQSTSYNVITNKASELWGNTKEFFSK